MALLQSTNAAAESVLGDLRATALSDRAWLALVALADADPANIVAGQLLAAAPSVQQLSLRNQITLLIQANQRGLVLRDIDTDAGWRRRGRAPNQSGLQIIRPHEGHAGKPTVTRGRGYRVVRRWEFGQTTPDPLNPPAQPQPDPPGDAACFAEHLIDQLGRRGYRIAPGQANDVDHATRLVTLASCAWHGDPAGAVPLLLKALAQALTADSAGVLIGRSRPGVCLTNAAM